MILNLELTESEKKILQGKFKEFKNEVLVLIRNSDLFTEDKILEGYFYSKTTRENLSGNKSNNTPLLKIKLNDYMEIIRIKDRECDSFEISWTKKIGKEKVSTGLFSTKEIDTLKEYQLYPMFLNNLWEKDYYFQNGKKENKNYNLFLDELKNYEKDICITNGEMEVLNNIFHLIKKLVSNIKIESKELDKKETQQKKSLKKSQTSLLQEFDKDENGLIDVIEGSDDFMILLKKHQKKIIEIDKQYIQNFVKVSNYLNTKRQNIQDIFSNIKETKNQLQLDENVGILKNQIHTYNLLLFHSLNMITSIVEDDLIVFYEIYESFDKLNMFNSNWENEVSEQLKNIEDGLSDLMYSINSMERNITSGLNRLNYVTQEGFSDLNIVVTRELKSIDSSIKFNNLLTGIQTYQMYKINKNTKRIE